jgi:hypothetical protein
MYIRGTEQRNDVERSVEKEKRQNSYQKLKKDLALTIVLVPGERGGN